MHCVLISCSIHFLNQGVLDISPSSFDRPPTWSFDAQPLSMLVLQGSHEQRSSRDQWLGGWHPSFKGIGWCGDERLWNEYSRYLNEQMSSNNLILADLPMAIYIFANDRDRRRPHPKLGSEILRISQACWCFFVSITVCLTTIEYYPRKCWSEYRWKRPLQAQSLLQSQTSHECRLLSIWPCLGSRQLLSLRDAMTLLEWRGWEFENRCDTCGIFSTGSHFAPGPVASDAPADIL